MTRKSTPKRFFNRYIFLGLLVASGVYAFSQHLGSTQAAGHSGALSHTQPAAVATTASHAYTNGSYTGSASDAYYGTVQVKAIVKNGQLADVQFLQYPNTHSYSIAVNNQAMPMLTQEAIQVQSAQVNGVSGATLTSQAFQQSLAAALVQARG